MNDDIRKVLDEHPTLEFDQVNRRFVGRIYIDAAKFDSYGVDIRLTRYGKSFPKVFETDERIPREPDRHVNSDGSLCFSTPARIEILRSNQVRTLLQFVNLILIPYLQHNSYYEINGTYISEFSHNRVIASFETFKEISGLDEPELIIKLIERVENGLRIRPNEECYCGSRKKIKKCGNHNQSYEDIKRLGKESLRREIVLLRRYVEEFDQKAK